MDLPKKPTVNSQTSQISRLIFTRKKENKKKVKLLSRIRLFATPQTVARQAPPSWDFPVKNTGVGCHFLLQGIFLTQGSNPGLLHCRQTLYPLSHQGSRYSGTEILRFFILGVFPTKKTCSVYAFFLKTKKMIINLFK